MPDMTPVAQDIQTPNPINAFANVVNLKTGLAQSQQAQQQNNELMALSAFTKKAMQDPSYHNDDGSLNVQKFQTDASSVAPVYGQAYIGQATQNANEGIENRQAMLNLSNAQRQTIGKYFQSVAEKPNATKSDVLDAIDEARGVSDDPMYQRSIDSFLLHAPQTDNMNPAQQSQAYRMYARNAAQAVGLPQVEPNMIMVQTPKGLQPTQVDPRYPIQGATQRPIKQGIAPQILTQPGTGAPNVVGPGGQASPITPAPQPGQPQAPQGQNWWNPAPGQLALLAGNTQGVVERTQAAAKAANTSPQAIDALTRAQSILDSGTWTGTAFSGFKDLKNLAASLGMDTSTAANASELAKNLARFEAARANSVGDTDAARALVDASGPNVKMDATAVKAVIQQSLANEQMIQGYARLMQNSPDPQTATQRETTFRSIPHLVQAYEAGQMKSQGDMDEFLKRYGISAADLAKSRQMLRDMGAL